MQMRNSKIQEYYLAAHQTTQEVAIAKLEGWLLMTANWDLSDRTGVGLKYLWTKVLPEVGCDIQNLKPYRCQNK